MVIFLYFWELIFAVSGLGAGVNALGTYSSLTWLKTYLRVCVLLTEGVPSFFASMGQSSSPFSYY